MKKISFIVIALILTVFVTGHFFIFKISQISHKANFRAFISQNLNQLEKIDISPCELYADSKKITWLDDNQEVMIGDLVYDIICIKSFGKKVSLFVVNDSNEKALMDTYSKLMGSALNTTNPLKSDLIKDFLSLKFLQNNSFEFILSNIFSLTTHYTAYTSSIISVFLSQENPPPIKF